MINYNLKFKWKDGKHHFISDLHYRHDRNFIWGDPKRGYSNVTEMNKDIIYQWNSQVGHEDTVWHLGDTIFGDTDASELLKLYERLNFKTLYCIFGNHTSGERTLFKAMMDEMGMEGKEVYPSELKINSEKKVVFLGYYAEIEIDGQQIVLSHYPHTSWRSQSKGAWNIHGHTHCNLKETDMKRIDIGWDYKNRPLSFKELIPIMAKKKRMTGGDYRGK